MCGLDKSLHLGSISDEVVYEFRDFAGVVVEDYGTYILYYGEC